MKPPLRIWNLPVTRTDAQIASARTGLGRIAFAKAPRAGIAITRMHLAGITVAAIALAVAAIALLAPPAHAQSKAGTTIGQFLLIEPSAQFAAMGNTGVAIADGLQSIYYNPAAAGPIENAGLQFTHVNWIADIGLEYVAAALPVRDVGTFYATVTALGSGDIEVRTVEQPLGTGERYSVSDVAIGLGFGRQFTWRFAAGLQVNYLQETIWHSSLSAVTFNMGTIYRINERGLQIGASISNFGTNGQFDGRDLAIQYDNDPSRNGDNSSLPGRRTTDEFPVPLLFRLGLSLPYRTGENGTVRFAVDAHHPNFNSESVSAGVEWTWKDALSIRAGYQNLFLDDTEVGPAFGAGFRGSLAGQPFQLDYAWTDQGRLEETHRFSFGLTF